MAAKKEKATLRTRGRPAGKSTKPRKRLPSTPLTDAQQLFIDRYMVRFNASGAYRDSHPECTRATAYSEGYRLRKHPRVSLEIDRRIKDMRDRYALTAERVLQELSAVAFGNISDFYEGHGSLVPPHELERDVSAALKEVKRTEIKQYNVETKQMEVVGHTVEVKMQDKVAALRLAGQHFELFTEKKLLTADDAILAALERGAARALNGA